MWRTWVVLAGLAGCVGVALGAYGAHGLDLPAERAGNYATAHSYQMWHLLGLLAAAWRSRDGGRGARLADLAGALFAAGMLLFCGSLYAMALAGSAPVPFAAPVGGTALMAGWLALAASALAARSR